MNFHTNLKKAIGKKIKMLRVEKEMTQEEFAKKIGTNQRVVSCWESGKHGISMTYLYEICKAFQINISYFV